MSSTQQVLAAVPPASANGPWRPPVHRRLHGSDFTWTIALVVPYAAVFFACGLTLTVEVCDLQLPFAGERLFLNGTAADSIPKRNSGSHLTCMGLFLSSRLFWVCLTVLCSEREGRSSSRRLRSGSRSARKGSRDRNASAAWRLCRLASLVFRSALTPEHAEGR